MKSLPQAFVHSNSSELIINQTVYTLLELFLPFSPNGEVGFSFAYGFSNKSSSAVLGFSPAFLHETETNRSSWTKDST